MPRLVADKPKTLAPVTSSAAAQALYHKRLMALIAELDNSLTYWLESNYRKVEPDLAMDRDPAVQMREVMDKLARRWRRRFDEAASDLARRFVDEASAHTDRSFASKLKRAGFTVKFQPTQRVMTVLKASVAENVGLIKSVAQQHLTQVEGLVMRSVTAGRDLGSLSKALQESYGVTKRRAALIARTQNNMASAAILRERQAELGIEQAMWVHSAAGRHPRESHVKAGREKLVYKVREGALIDGERIWPGQLINCRCYCRPIIPGFDD